MSRKKSPKSKGGTSGPSSALPAAQAQPQGGRAKGAPGAGASPSVNGPPPPPPQPPVPPVPAGRPSLSASGEFYDVAFKVMLVGDSGVGKTCLLVRFKDGAFLAGTFISTVGIDFRVTMEACKWDQRGFGSTDKENKVLNVDGVKVKLQIWDTAGQERFRSVTHAYYRDAHALLLLYDVTNRASFDNIQALQQILFLSYSAKLQLKRFHGSNRKANPLAIGQPSKLEFLKKPNITNLPLSFGEETFCKAIQGLAWLTEINEYAKQDVVLMLLGNKVDSTQERVVKREDGEKLAKEYGVPFMETSAKSGLNVDLAFTAIAKELKHRSMKLPHEPRFKLHDYVKKEVKSTGCCRS